MKFNLRHILACLTTVFALAFSQKAFAQLPTIINVSTTSASCDGVSDATLTVEFDGGNFPLTVAIVGPGILESHEQPSGTGPFSHTFTGLPDGNGSNGVGNYTVVVRDQPSNQVISSASIADTEPISIVVDNITDLCLPSLGAIDLTVSGGTGPGTYSFAWTGPTTIGNTEDPTNLAAGSYAVEVTDGNGCMTTLNNIVVEDGFTATISGDASICEMESTNLAVTITGGTGPYTIEIDNGVGVIPNYSSGNSISVSPTSTTTYNLISVTDANGCNAASLNGTATVTVNPLPTVTITPAGPFCENATAVNLVGSPIGGTWSGVGITDVANGTFDPAVAGVGSHIITYEFTDGNGCMGSATETIEVSILPDAGTDATIDACITDNAIDLMAALGGTPQGGGTWNDDDGSGGLTGSIFDATVAGVTAGNTYNFTYTVSSPGCAPATATVSVNVNAEPNTGTGSNGTACVTVTNFDLFTLLTGFDAGGTWNDDDLTLALSGPNNEIFDPSAIGVGSYNFTYIINSPSCPPGTTTVTVDVIPNLSAGTALANVNTCYDETAFDLFNGLTGHDAGGSWNDDDATGALTGNLFDASAVAPGSYQFTYSVAAPGCTPDTETITVIVNPGPTADAGIDQSVCSGSTFLNASLGANETGVWTVVAGTGTFADATDPNTEVTALSVGLNTFQWEVTNTLTTCTSTDAVDINFTDLTLPNAGPDQTICTTSTTLAANNYDNLTEIGIWSYTGPVLPAPVFDDPNDPNTLVTGLIDGETYNFRWTIADINPFGCGANDDFVTVDVIGTITTADAGIDQNVCNTFTTLAANAADVNETGTWTVVSGTGIFADANNPNTAVTGLSQGLNQFQWEISDNTATCPSSDDVVDINVIIVTPANAGPDQNICTTNTTLAANAVGANETGTWTIVSGTGIFADANDPNTTVTGLSQGLNQFQWEIADNTATCPPTVDVVDINVASITIAAAGPDQNICTTSTTLAANAVGANETGFWSVVTGTGIFADVNDPNTTVSGLTVGTNVLRWTISDNNGICPPTQSDVTIDITGSITAANAGPDQTICFTSTNLAANGPAVNETGTWTIISGSGVFADVNDPNSAVTGLSAGINEFQWTIAPTSGPCPPSTDVVTVEVSTSTTANAGPDQNICTTSTTLAANTVGANETGFWSVVSGTGVFADVNDPVTGVSGLTVGTNVLRWTISDNNGICPPTQSDVTINIIGNITAANAGPDQAICFTSTNLAANAVGANETGTWTLVSGTGVFADATDPNSAVTGLSAGINEFQWTIAPTSGPCPPSTDVVTVEVSTSTTANAGPDQSICATSTTLAANAVGANETGTWSVVSGSGIFADVNNPTTGVSGLTVGANVLRWTISDNNGICPPTQSDVTINIIGNLTLADAGPDQNICTTSTTLAANAVGANETGIWSVVSGTGIFDDINDPTTSVNGLSVGTNVLRWTISDNNGICPPTQSDVTIEITGSITAANAGTDLAICFNFTNLAANSPGVNEIGTWTVISGTGIFADANDPNTVVTGLSVGTNEFQWSIAPTSGPCPPSTDIVSIEVNSSTLADAGPDQNICTTNTTLAANAVGANETGTWSVVTGTGVFADINDPATGVSGLTVGTNVLRWTISDNNGICPPTQSDVTVTIVGSITAADAGTDQNICTTNTTLAANSAGVNEIGTWTVISGSGIFADINDPNSAVTGLLIGTNEFQWSIAATSGPCPPSDDIVTVQVNTSTVANAGPDQNICVTNTVLAANVVGGNEIGTWSVVTGTGVFADVNDPATSVSGLTVGTNVLRWTISDNNGICPPTQSDVTVTIVGSITAADAGPDQNICTTNTTLAANSAGVNEIGTWTVVSGSGIFADINDPNSAVTGLSFGTNEFQWSIAPTSGPCPPSDDIVTVEVNSITVANAGPDQNICVTSTTLAANAVGVNETGTWSIVSGTAIFVDVNDPATSVSGLTAGTNVLRWTISDNNGICPSTQSDVTIDIIGSLTAANAGPDQAICVNFTSLAANSAGVNEIGTWTVISGSGIFADANNPSTVVTGLSAGVNEFQWSIAPTSGPCPPSDDVVSVEVSAITTASAGPDQNICTTNTTLAANAVGADETGTWSVVSGTGAFADVNDPSSTVSGLTVGTNVLRWTISDNNGVCPSTQSDVTINIIGSITAANAGSDQAICVTATNLAANNPGINETGTWTVVSGSGIFADATDPNSAVTGLSTGVNEFQWSIAATSGPCPPSTDIVSVEVSDNTMADAGPDQNICTTNTTLAANTVGANETGTWSIVSGTAIFADVNDPASTVSGLTVGTNVLRWTISDNNGVCPSTQSDVTISIIGSLTAANAGPDQAICVTATNLAANSPGLNETGTWTVVSGSGIFADATDPNSAVTGLSVGVNEFQWSIAATSGPCPPSNDVVSVEVGANTVADAGPDQNICVTSTILAANAVGANETGTWTLVSGTGTFDDLNDPNTQVTGLSNGNNVFRWTITDNNGVCATTQSDVTVQKIGNLTAADAGPDQAVCDTFTNLAANTTGATETGTWTVVSGTGIFTNANDPATTVTGMSAGLNEFQWEIADNVGTCPASNDIVAVTVNSVTTAIPGPDQNICNNFTTLAANPAGANETGMWLVATGSGTFTDINDPNSGVNGLSIGVNQFAWTIIDDTGVCPASQDVVTINVLSPTDPLCSGGGGVNCGAFVISVTETRPSCLDNDDGAISFNITGGSGSYTVLLTNNNGFNKGETGTSAAVISFQDLTADNYEYTVDDGLGNICALPYSLVRQTTVKATAADFVDVICFGTSTGEARITITEGGNAPYEYSIDGLVWNTLPPNGVVTNLPALGNYNVLVRDDVSDQCPAEVPVSINNAFQEIALTFNANDATCNNAGGSIEVLTVTGGQAPYRYRLDGVDFTDLPANNTFEDLTAGFHFLTVFDDNNCERNYNILVDAPGLVLFTSSVTNPDCDGNGQNGSISIQIDPLQLPGSFEAAISTEIDEDGEFQFVPSNGIMDFSNLAVGTYYVTVVTAGGCPNKVPITISGGPVALGFDLTLECFDNNQAVLLSNITVEDDNPFNIEVYRVGEITPIDVITLPDLPAGNIFRITSANFLNAIGNYQLLLTQDQAACGSSLSSDVENFTIKRPLAATLGEINQSLPERATGSIMINNITGGEGGYQILIEPSDGSLIDVPQNQTNQEFEYQFTDLTPGVYEIFISDMSGCEIMLSAEVPRDTELFIPNIFTPNGDTFNETFFIRNLPLDGTKLHISNRLGRKVYETDNYQNDWDGEDNADGIYYYTIEIGDQKYSGWIEIWRGGNSR